MMGRGSAGLSAVAPPAIKETVKSTAPKVEDMRISRPALVLKQDFGQNPVPVRQDRDLIWTLLKMVKAASAADRRRERALVEIIELAADRHAVREPRHLHVGVVQQVGDVVRGGLAIDRGVEREDDLLHRRIVRARDQRIDGQVLRADAVERRERAAEHVIARVDAPRRAPAPRDRRRPPPPRSPTDRAADRCTPCRGSACRCCRRCRTPRSSRSRSAARAASGAISGSRFLIRCSAARRAERGPSPGRRASSWIRRSISGPATAGMLSLSFRRA